MVGVLYAVILVPIVIYLVFILLEIWLTYRIAMRRHSRSLLFVQASTEVTHTLLVFSYAQFMVTFSDLLTRIGARLWWPVALLIVTLLVRGSLYLLLFYREHVRTSVYTVLLITYLIGVVALLWALTIIVGAIVAERFIPDASQVPILVAAGIPTLLIIVFPLSAIYRHALKQLQAK